MTTVVIVGASGYVGSRLVASLTATSGVVVRAIQHRPAPWVGGEHWAIEGLSAACEGADTVVHLAGANEVAASHNPEAAVADTIRITQRVAAAATRAHVSRVVYVSTVHVYGSRLKPGAEITEDLRPEPRTPYAIARLASEHLLAGATTNPVIFRLTNSVGAPVDPRVDRWSLVANDLCRQAVTMGELRLRTSGTQWRDFVALSDVGNALMATALTTKIPGGTYNLGSGHPCTVRHLAGLIQDRVEAMTGDRPLLLAPPPEVDPPRSYRVSTSRLAEAGFRATTPIEAAIDETLQFALAHRGQLAAPDGPRLP